MFILFVFQHVVLGYKLNKKKHFSEISNPFLFISIADCLPMVLNCRASHRQDKGREGRGGEGWKRRGGQDSILLVPPLFVLKKLSLAI